jgi:hypothetical protein
LKYIIIKVVIILILKFDLKVDPSIESQSELTQNFILKKIKKSHLVSSATWHADSNLKTNPSITLIIPHNLKVPFFFYYMVHAVSGFLVNLACKILHLLKHINTYFNLLKLQLACVFLSCKEAQCFSCCQHDHIWLT